MSMWWIRSEWKKACCNKCGRNIWDSGGDPDWGYCYEHFQEIVEEKKRIKKMILEHEKSIIKEHEESLREKSGAKDE